MNIIVIGAGVVGMFAAYYLAKDGHSVELVDMETDGGQTSIYNGGLIVPSFAATPPIGFRKILGAYVGLQGPVYVSPFEVLRNVSWLGAMRNARRSENVLTEFGMKSLSLYKAFFKEQQIDVDLKKGVLGLYKSADLAREEAHKLKGRFLDSKEVASEGFRGFGGGVLFEEELAINTVKLHTTLRNKLTDMGVKLTLNNRAQFHRGHTRVNSVLLNERQVTGDAFVVASGAWSRILCRPLDYDPHIVPGRGLQITFTTGGRSIIRHAALFEDYGIALNQNNLNSFIVTGFFELNGFQKGFSEARKSWLINALDEHLIESMTLKYVSEGVGYRPCTSDQLPVIGKIPHYENVVITAGHCRLGLTLAAATGDAVNEIISNPNRTQTLPPQFDPARFGNTP